MSKRSSLPGATDDDPDSDKVDQKLKSLDLPKRVEGETMSSSNHKRPRRYLSLLQLSATKPPSVLSAFAFSVLDPVRRGAPRACGPVARPLRPSARRVRRALRGTAPRSLARGGKAPDQGFRSPLCHCYAEIVLRTSSCVYRRAEFVWSVTVVAHGSAYIVTHKSYCMHRHAYMVMPHTSLFNILLCTAPVDMVVLHTSFCAHCPAEIVRHTFSRTPPPCTTPLCMRCSVHMRRIRRFAQHPLLHLCLHH